MQANSVSLQRKVHLQGILELICQQFELTPTQRQLAEERYEAIGRWLSDSPDSRLKTALIYPQGSIRLGTTVKPVGQEEFDLDLVCRVEDGFGPGDSPVRLKELIGDRLRSNGTYQDLLEEKKRCWRIDYANEFHLDITPSIPNPACAQGGELVPDRELTKFKETNPRGYAEWFERLAETSANIVLRYPEMESLRAEVEPVPAHSMIKGVLKRSVQLMKRHRDVTIEDEALRPISIILTTLAARSYALCATSSTFETELDLMFALMVAMPRFIDIRDESGERRYYIWNETTQGENFAEKWNEDPRLAQVFFDWHRHAVSGFREFADTTGLDQLRRKLTGGFGEIVVAKAFTRMVNEVSEAREAGRLGATASGLTIGSSTSARVQRNTFYGS